MIPFSLCSNSKWSFVLCLAASAAPPPHLSNVQLRRWLNTASATIGTGNLELAERLVLRNRQLGQMKAESLVRVIQLNEQVLWLCFCLVSLSPDLLVAAPPITTHHPHPCALPHSPR